MEGKDYRQALLRQLRIEPNPETEHHVVQEYTTTEHNHPMNPKKSGLTAGTSNYLVCTHMLASNTYQIF